MRKLFMLAAMALAAMAVIAPSAQAVNTDFPHGDTEADNWRAVMVYDWATGDSCDIAECQFSGDADDWKWEYGSPLTGRYGSFCSYPAFDGSFSGSGGVSLSNVGWLLSGGEFCWSWETVALPWSGDICARADSDEFWVRQELSIRHTGSGQVQSGVSFGRLPDYNEIEYIRFGSPTSGAVDTEMGGVMDFKQLVEFSFNDGNHNYHDVFATGDDDSPDVVPAAPCGWPELS